MVQISTEYKSKGISAGSVGLAPEKVVHDEEEMLEGLLQE